MPFGNYRIRRNKKKKNKIEKTSIKKEKIETIYKAILDKYKDYGNKEIEEKQID